MFLFADEGKLLKDFMVKGKLITNVGGLSLKYGGYMAITSAALLIAKNVELPLVNDKGKDSNCEEAD